MADLNLDTRFSIPSQVMSRLVGDETVLLDLQSGLYFGLDGVGQRIWESVAEGGSLGGAVEAVTAEYDVDEAQAAADVVDFAANLVERGLLEVQ
jgi:hypothetical protein